MAHFAFLQAGEDAVQITDGIGLQPGLHFPVGNKMKDEWTGCSASSMARRKE
jgi:hypothetical protein